MEKKVGGGKKMGTIKTVQCPSNATSNQPLQIDGMLYSSSLNLLPFISSKKKGEEDNELLRSSRYRKL